MSTEKMDLEEFFWDSILAPEATFLPITQAPSQAFKPL